MNIDYLNKTVVASYTIDNHNFFYNQLGEQFDELLFKSKDVDDEHANALNNKREEIKSKAREIRAAINDLGNALGHLGYEVEPFLG